MATISRSLIKYSTLSRHLYLYATLYTMENGSQTKRPLDEKPEEINEKVSKRETMESPVEQKLQREGQDPESTGNKTSEPESQKQSDKSEQTATAMPGTKKITDKQSKPRGFGLRAFSLLGGTKDERNKEYWQNLALDDKRTKYKCGNKYLTLSDIPSWPQFQASSENTCQPSSTTTPVNTVLNDKISLWRGDITRLEIDAIVNAANSSLMGGGGVDGAIHSAASTSLRDECRELNGCDVGDAKLTTGHRLPAKYILHTVGPMDGNPNHLTSCYERCLELVLEHKIRSVAFCCIATGVYGFPNEKACKIALATTRKWLETNDNAEKVDKIIFTVFLQNDYQLYKQWLHHYFPLEETGSERDPTPPAEEATETMETGPSLGRADLPILGKSVTEPPPTNVAMAINSNTEKEREKEDHEKAENVDAAVSDDNKRKSDDTTNNEQA